MQSVGSRDAEAAAVAVRRGLAKLGRRLRAQEAPGGSGSTALSILGRLFRDGPASATDLAASERLQPQSLTRTLRSLEESRLIARLPDAADRRRSIIWITDSGIALLQQSVRARESWLARAMDAALTDVERDMLVLAAALMERLADVEIEGRS
jgi:DNA-binding MarR family transcriptional regulator